MSNGRGGYREGAGRKPKALRYQEQVTAIEEKIVAMLPRLTDKLFEMAMEGDIRATRYLMDRVLGRVPMLEAAPSADRSMPYSEREFKREVLERNLNLCDDELRLEQRAVDMFEYVGDDDEQTDDDLIPMSPEETDDLLRKARVEQGPSPQPSPSKGEGEDAGQFVAPSRSAPFPNNGVADCGSVPARQVRSDIDAPDDSVDTAASITSRFIPSDGPNDPDRTWYDPS